MYRQMSEMSTKSVIRLKQNVSIELNKIIMKRINEELKKKLHKKFGKVVTERFFGSNLEQSLIEFWEEF